MFVFVRRWSQIPVVFCDGGLKCRDLLEPEFIHKCRGLCLDADCSVDANNATSENNKTSDPLWSPHSIEPDINNETFNLLIPAAVPSTVGVANERRPDFYVEDKIQQENLKVIEMQIIILLIIWDRQNQNWTQTMLNWPTKHFRATATRRCPFT